MTESEKFDLEDAIYSLENTNVTSVQKLVVILTRTMILVLKHILKEAE